METEIVYITTKEECQNHIDLSNRVCSGCGGILEPLETVDNAGTPTHWAGCLTCSQFDSGVSKEVFQTAQDLILNQHHREYGDYGGDYGKTGESLAYWQHGQIRAATRTVLMVLTTYNKFNK